MGTKRPLPRLSDIAHRKKPSCLLNFQSVAIFRDINNYTMNRRIIGIAILQIQAHESTKKFLMVVH